MLSHQQIGKALAIIARAISNRTIYVHAARIPLYRLKEKVVLGEFQEKKWLMVFMRRICTSIWVISYIYHLKKRAVNLLLRS